MSDAENDNILPSSLQEQLVDFVDNFGENTLHQQYDASDDEEDLAEMYRNKITHTASSSVIDHNISQNDISIDDFGTSDGNSPLSVKSNSNKMLSYMLHLHTRTVDVPIEIGVDEWENDEDTGYIVCTVSEEEYYDFDQISRQLVREKAMLAQQSLELKASYQIHSPVDLEIEGDGDSYNVEGRNADEELSSGEHSRVDSLDGGDEGDDLLDQDLLAAEMQLARSSIDVSLSAAESALPSPGAEERRRIKREDATSFPPPPPPDMEEDTPRISAEKRAIDTSSKDIANSILNDSVSASLEVGERAMEETDLLPPPHNAIGSAIAENLAAGQFGAALGGKTAQIPQPSYPPEPSMQRPNKRQSMGELRRKEITGQHSFVGADGVRSCFFNLKVIFDPYRTGFEENKEFQHPKGTIIAGRYQVADVLGTAAFSTALQCVDLIAEEDEAQWVCLKVIKNNKDFFDQSCDEIKLLQFINSHGDPDRHNVLRLIDYFYYKEHLFIVSELLKENLYEFGRFIRENGHEPYYTLPRLKRIMKQILTALQFIHSLNLIHCDIKPENIVIKSFSRCEVKLIDFGSSCYTTDHLTTYIQSRSYRAPEVILGLTYDPRIDIWSIGAVLAELLTGYVLFQNDSVPTMLSRITAILGPFPPAVLQRGRDVPKYFTKSGAVYDRDEEGNFQVIFPKRTSLASRLHLQTEFNPDTDASTDTLSHSDALFLDFTTQLLNLDPELRLTASEALQHPWLSDADTIEFPEYVIGTMAAPPATAHSSGSSGMAHSSTHGASGICSNPGVEEDGSEDEGRDYRYAPPLPTEEEVYSGEEGDDEDQDSGEEADGESLAESYEEDDDEEAHFRYLQSRGLVGENEMYLSMPDISADFETAEEFAAYEAQLAAAVAQIYAEQGDFEEAEDEEEGSESDRPFTHSHVVISESETLAAVIEEQEDEESEGDSADSGFGNNVHYDTSSERSDRLTETERASACGSAFSGPEDRRDSVESSNYLGPETRNRQDTSSSQENNLHPLESPENLESLHSSELEACEETVVYVQSATVSSSSSPKPEQQQAPEQQAGEEDVLGERVVFQPERQKSAERLSSLVDDDVSGSSNSNNGCSSAEDTQQETQQQVTELLDTSQDSFLFTNE